MTDFSIEGRGKSLFDPILDGPGVRRSRVSGFETFPEGIRQTPEGKWETPGMIQAAPGGIPGGPLPICFPRQGSGAGRGQCGGLRFSSVALRLPFGALRFPTEGFRKPLATPVIGGKISSLLHMLIVTPVIFLWLRGREFKKPVSMPHCSLTRMTPGDITGDQPTSRAMPPLKPGK